jgi:hypothetical protein
MNSIIQSSISYDQVPGEPFLISCLQKNLSFSIGNKVIKRGKLLLFRRVHYYVQISLMTDKTDRENFEIPIPFRIENYNKDGLLYFDYRVSSLRVNNLPPIPDKVPSTYYNKILELHVA